MHIYDDPQLSWKLGTLYVPIREFSGLLSSAGADASEGAGGPVHAASSLAASELTVVLMAAAGDEVYHFMPLPADWNMAFDVRARVWFFHASTDADAPIWKLLYQFYAAQAALTDCGAAGDGTVTFTAHTCSTTDDSIEVTTWESLGTTTGFATGDVAWAFCLECHDLGSASANEIELAGLEFQYTREMLSGEARETT